MKRVYADVLLIGSGVAGLYAALHLSPDLHVILVTKSGWPQSNSYQAQGGIAVALHPGDSFQEHIRDTLRAGCDLNDRDAVETLVLNSHGVINDLLALGVPFDLDQEGELALGQEAFHSYPRIIHAGGDATGMMVVKTLMEHVLRLDHVRIEAHAWAQHLVLSGQRCCGAVLIKPDGPVHVEAKAVILATGGAGQLYSETTNASTSTGDGLALALEAGAELIDMEFVQFHPTALDVPLSPKPLISEAVRGEGVTLINEQGRRFMPDYHPWAELAPRDVVARAIFDQKKRGHRIFLNTPLLGERFKHRFPTIDQRLKSLGFDPSHEPVPVTPAAHFLMGGVKTDLWGRTTVPGLYACGEVACTGVHGANRLASNSLLEGLVFAKRIAEVLITDLSHSSWPGQRVKRQEQLVTIKRPAWEGYPDLDVVLKAEATKTLQALMWQEAGLIRTEKGLNRLYDALCHWQEVWGNQHPLWAHMASVALLMTRAALERKESRGAHYREDYPDQSEEWMSKRISWRKENDELVMVGGTVETSPH